MGNAVTRQTNVVLTDDVGLDPNQTPLGTITNPIHTDPTGTTPQPVETPGSDTCSLSQVAVGNSYSLILAANPLRIECIVTNTGNTVIYMGLEVPPTNTLFNLSLAACSNPNDGTGGTYFSDNWKGDIYAICVGTGVCNVSELT
jgi:hypothetical protein